MWIREFSRTTKRSEHPLPAQAVRQTVRMGWGIRKSPCPSELMAQSWGSQQITTHTTSPFNSQRTQRRQGRDRCCRPVSGFWPARSHPCLRTGVLRLLKGGPSPTGSWPLAVADGTGVDAGQLLALGIQAHLRDTVVRFQPPPHSELSSFCCRRACFPFVRMCHR